jgi:hypothetical protein
MLDAKEGLQPAATIGKVFHRPYEPFRTPDRAREEELGDVLAEGTFWLLDQDRPIADAGLRHWRDFLPLVSALEWLARAGHTPLTCHHA